MGVVLETALRPPQRRVQGYVVVAMPHERSANNESAKAVSQDDRGPRTRTRTHTHTHTRMATGDWQVTRDAIGQSR
jgi:hypothetical protein